MTDLPKIKAKSKKRIGRGYGSGKGGHTVGRGTKGQKARSHINVLFEGIKVKKSLLKKLPLRRGKDKLRPGKKPIIIKLSYLNLLDAGSVVDLNLLIKEGIVEKEMAYETGVKILGDGKLTKKLTIAVPISKSAAKDVIKAGGTIKEK
jgi:large subunit ribosomal protein L15